MINIYFEKEIRTIAEGGKILAKVIKKVSQCAKIGVATEDLDKVAEDLIFKYGAESSFKGFNGYPATLCVSINEDIVHGVPSKRKLKPGDIFTLDLGLKYKGYYSDMAITIILGKVDKRVKKLTKVTKKSLDLAIKQAKAGKHLGDIGWAIQSYVEKNGFNVIRELIGHGVGRKVHEAPEILNFGEKGEGVELKQGMVLAIEPMVSMGNWRIEKSKDGFAYKTIDNSLSAHFEHTIAITKRGPKILTKP